MHNFPSLHLAPGTPHAVLSTPDRNYVLTQRNTSNSLVLLTPAPAASSPTAAAATTPDPEPGLATIGTVHETIELAPEPPKAERSLAGMKHTGSMGKWDERTGTGR